MADGVQAFLSFCEDVRVEEFDKPMMIGMLSPLFYIGSPDGKGDKLQLVTQLLADYAVEAIELALVVRTLVPTHEVSEGSYSQTLKRPDEIMLGEPWAAVLPIQVDVPEWLDGATIEASLEANGTKATTRVRCAISPAEADQDE